MNDNDQPISLQGPPAYQVRDRELPQRLLGILLWVALFFVLWTLGTH